MCGLACYGSAFCLWLWCAWLPRTSTAISLRYSHNALHWSSELKASFPHLNCFCQTFRHSEKSNEHFSHRDTGEHPAEHCCALRWCRAFPSFPLWLVPPPSELRNRREPCCSDLGDSLRGYKFQVCVSTNFICWNSNPSGMVLRRGFGK